MQRPLSRSTLLGLNANWAGLSFMWNALHPIVLPALLLDLVPTARKNTYLGLLTFAGLLIAMLLQPLSGAASDRWVSKHGRRRPLIVIGTLFDCLFLIMLGMSGGLTWVVVGYVGLQVSSNTAQGPLQGLLRDRVPVSQLGIASSMKVLIDLLSLVAAALVAGRLMKSAASGVFPIILVIIAMLLVTAAITVVVAREQRTDLDSGGPSVSATLDLTAGAGVARGYWWLIGERALFLLGVYGLQAFGQYYLQDALGVSNAPQQVGFLLATIGASTVVLVAVGGSLVDRFGARPILLAASALAGTGMLLMSLVTDLRSLYLIGTVVGAGIGLFLTSNWAIANQLAPAAQAGKYLGLTNLATAGAAALARLEGPGVDLLNAFRPGAWLGYKGIFILGAVFIFASAWLLAKLK
jgi:MFS family permease